MIIRKLRLQRAWSQQQLAEISGLNIRTIQRIEKGQAPSLESLKALAATFDTHVDSLTEAKDMTTANTNITQEERDAIEEVKKLKEFYLHLMNYCIMMPVGLFIFLNYMPKATWWMLWVFLGWTFAICAHALSVFCFGKVRLFSAAWEKRQIEKRLGRRL